MKRYDPGWGGIEPADDGDYVEYDEAAARIARLEAENARLEAMIKERGMTVEEAYCAGIKEGEARADAAFNEGVEAAAMVAATRPDSEAWTGQYTYGRENAAIAIRALKRPAGEG